MIAAIKFQTWPQDIPFVRRNHGYPKFQRSARAGFRISSSSSCFSIRSFESVGMQDCLGIISKTNQKIRTMNCTTILMGRSLQLFETKIFRVSRFRKCRGAPRMPKLGMGIWSAGNMTPRDWPFQSGWNHHPVIIGRIKSLQAFLVLILEILVYYVMKVTCHQPYPVPHTSLPA